jgi:2-hydroxy-3-keto-5-methylthiopentenyl-1-phosphate phosphatase
MRRILITDFDGTLCRQDFYQLVIHQILPATVPNYWQEYLDHKISHFEVLQKYFAEIRCSEAELETLLTKMRQAGRSLSHQQGVAGTSRSC